MDTFPQDLIKPITNLIRTSDCLLLGLETPDNRPYLSLATLKARLKLALKYNNVGWVHQIAKYLQECYTGSIDTRFIVKLQLKYKSKLFDIFHFISPRSYYCDAYDHYLHGKRGDQSIMNANTDTFCRGRFVEGLSKGQHYELFEKYAFDVYTNFFYIANFEDEDYIINKLNLTINREHQLFSRLFDTAIRLKRFKVVRYLLDKHKKKFSRTTCCIIGYLIHTNEYKGEKYDSTGELKYAIFSACLISNYEALDYIYNNSNKKSFRKVLSTSLITKELEQYALEHFKLRVKNNDPLINSVSKLRLYIDQCSHFRSSPYSIEYHSGVFEFIVDLLIDHYIEIDDMIGLKAVYTIIIESELLPKLSFNVDSVILLQTHNLYQSMSISELRRTAEDRGIRTLETMSRSKLTLALMEGCC